MLRSECHPRRKTKAEAKEKAKGEQREDLRDGGLIHAHYRPPVDVTREPVGILPKRPALQALEPLSDVLGGPVDRLHEAHVWRLLDPCERDVLLDLGKGVLACSCWSPPGTLRRRRRNERETTEP